jgi:hypothetical protein
MQILFADKGIELSNIGVFRQGKEWTVYSAIRIERIEPRRDGQSCESG